MLISGLDCGHAQIHATIARHQNAWGVAIVAWVQSALQLSLAIVFGTLVDLITSGEGNYANARCLQS